MTNPRNTNNNRRRRHGNKRDTEDEKKDVQREEEEVEYDGKTNWNDSKTVAEKFFDWIHNEWDETTASVDLNSVNRDEVSKIYDSFFKSLSKRNKTQKRREGLVMSALRQLKLMRSRRYDGVVVCSFARPDKTFAPIQERQTAREKELEKRRELVADKGGISVFKDPFTTPNGQVKPINHDVSVVYPIILGVDGAIVDLINVTLTGSQKKSFQVKTILPYRMSLDDETSTFLDNLADQDHKLELTFRAKGTGVYRTNIIMEFEDIKNGGKRFTILRNLALRSGDSVMYDMLKPTSPYKKKKRAPKEKPVKKEDIVHAPPQQSKGGGKGSGGSSYNNDLRQYKVPIDVRELVENKEMEGSLVKPTYDNNSNNNQEFGELYSTFWQNLLWASELQAYEDIKLYDVEYATFERSGRFLKLYVAGLAEGRPSVLRDDIVLCTWRGKQYRGRVFAVEMLDILLEFHKSFHKEFDVRVDRVDRVRFTFSRTAFRTSHAGCLRAPKQMGQSMLMPQPFHMSRITGNSKQRDVRIVPDQFNWASKTLNEEQKEAVKQICQGTLRPMPYAIFGPPGTGKTSTIVETVYQLARLHTYKTKGKDQQPQQEKLKILLVAPSNDATDILVEKLAPYFPPSEMIRVLAYTRRIDDVPTIARPYVRDDLEPKDVVEALAGVQIVVSTMNLAARLWCTGDGVKRGHFDVLCVDEAGHATEPEVIGVAATIMKFNGKSPAQLVLAGDPMQLGPIITSEICKKFGMGVSYMERLVKESPAYKVNEEGEYPPELVTFLERNYRSHPAILKLPNEMFYNSKLIPSGDKLMTHSMVKWEHLPGKTGFPVVFHAIDGENLREGNSPSWFNPQEASEVVNYVKLLTKHSRPAIGQDDIGIITPYARQVQKIKLALKADGINDVKVGSVETFQGQERRCIIISTVRSENEYLDHDRKYNLGFVANEKRFNVAVTRAKALLIVVGNPRVLATDKKNWLPMLRYCRDNKSWFGEEWNEEEQKKDEEEEFGNLEKDPANKDEKDEDEDDWHFVGDQEACGFINREE